MDTWLVLLLFAVFPVTLSTSRPQQDLTVAKDVRILQQEIDWLKDVVSDLNKKVNDNTDVIATANSDISSNSGKISSLETSVDDERTETIYCAWRDGYWGTSNSVITYDLPTVSAGPGSLNTGTGVFTAAVPGYYSVSYGAEAILDGGERAWSYLYRNGYKISETYMGTHNTGDTRIYNRVDRTLVVHLNYGDTLDWRTDSDHFSGEYYRVTFCVSLDGL